MIIERHVAKYTVFNEDSLLSALRRIGENKSGFVFVVSESGVLEGVLTDGDLRRWLVAQKDVDLDQPVSKAANPNFVSCPVDAPPERVAELFADNIRFVPLLDRQSRLVGVATRASARLQIGHITIADDAPTFIIAEIGNNHNGSIERAFQLVDEAAAAGAHCAKFQLRHMEGLYRNGSAGGADEDLGAQYTMDLLARFQLKTEDMFKVFDHCKAKGLLPLCTPWDVASLATLERYGMPGYKIASADLINHDLIEAAAATRKPLLCSTGMSTEAEILETVAILRRAGAPYALLHCNSTYPAPFKDVNLNYIPRLKKIGDCPVGYSGHERGISVAVAAVAMGARIIEKHFTLDRNLEGNDHRVSLLPAEFQAMVQGVREVEQSFGDRESRKITQGEMMNREVLGKSLVAARAIKAGEKITADAVDVRSPGRGLQPNRRTELLGKSAQRDMAAGDFFYPSDVQSHRIEPRRYSFPLPFGVPVRYHDVKEMSGKSNFDLLEFHLSYKDMELDPKPFLDPKGYDLDLMVHSPELFAGDHLMDLSSPDEAYRQRSIDELQRVVDITLALKPYFKRAKRPLIIINAGGFTLDGPMPVADRAALYERIAESLKKVREQGVEIIPQTMPPFPWHFGGQRYHNLFMDATEIADFCAKHGRRVCLDVSHSKLACANDHTSFKDLLEIVGPYTAHLHMVDAQGVDGEGLQIGEGEVDFAMTAEVLVRTAPKASFIPEIWQGHKNGGEGFWTAFERLEPFFKQAGTASAMECIKTWRGT